MEGSQTQNGIQRTPIIGIQRVPISSENRVLLDWNEVHSKFDNLIKFAASQVTAQYQTGAVNSAEDMYQEGKLLLYECYLKYIDKSMEEFTYIFKSSLWRKLRGIGSKESKTISMKGSEIPVVCVDLEDAYDVGYNDNTVEDIYNEFKLQQVAEMLKGNDIALTILKEYINPSTRTLWEVEMDMARKQMLKDQDYSSAVPKTMKVRSFHIQRAMNIPKTRFTEALKTLKEVVASVYDVKETSSGLIAFA